MPQKLVHTRWKITHFEEEMYNFRKGTTYPHPIIDIKKSRKHALDVLWRMHKQPLVFQDRSRILNRHTFNK